MLASQLHAYQELIHAQGGQNVKLHQCAGAPSPAHNVFVRPLGIAAMARANIVDYPRVPGGQRAGKRPIAAGGSQADYST
jgi:hypothetical protein